MDAYFSLFSLARGWIAGHLRERAIVFGSKQVWRDLLLLLLFFFKKKWTPPLIMSRAKANLGHQLLRLKTYLPPFQKSYKVQFLWKEMANFNWYSLAFYTDTQSLWIEISDSRENVKSKGKKAWEEIFFLFITTSRYLHVMFLCEYTYYFKILILGCPYFEYEKV